MSEPRKTSDPQSRRAPISPGNAMLSTIDDVLVTGDTTALDRSVTFTANPHPTNRSRSPRPREPNTDFPASSTTSLTPQPNDSENLPKILFITNGRHSRSK